MVFALAVLSVVPVAVSQMPGLDSPQAQFQQPQMQLQQAAWLTDSQQSQFQQTPGGQFAQHGFPQFQQPVPDLAQYQQPLPDLTQQYQQTPDLTLMQFGSQQTSEQDAGSCGLAADADSECCKIQQEKNPLSQGTPLNTGGVYCAQAADSRWWNVEVVKQNCDGSYAVVVQDDAKSEWAVTHRALMLDQSCDDFYAEALRDSGVEAPQLEGLPQLEAVPVQDISAKDISAKVQSPGPSVPSSPAGKASKTPWKVMTAAAAAGAVPLIYTFTSAGAA